MAIAVIAYPHLTSTTKQRVDALLQLNPNYKKWIQDIEPGDRQQIAFIKASTWADEIKRDADYDSNPEHGDAPIRNIGYRDKQQHRQWHYINLPFTADNTPLPSAITPNLRTQIAALRNVLQTKNLNADTQSYSLVWLVHLVGDAHQPLHATSRFSHEFPRGDQGGNAIILCDSSCNQNLHEYWDRTLGTTHKPRSIIRMATGYPAADPQRGAILDETVWLQESADISRQYVYAAPVGNAADSIVLSKSYKSTARDIAQKQAAVAGTRLANLLNKLFGQ